MGIRNASSYFFLVRTLDCDESSVCVLYKAYSVGIPVSISLVLWSPAVRQRLFFFFLFCFVFIRELSCHRANNMVNL